MKLKKIKIVRIGDDTTNISVYLPTLSKSKTKFDFVYYFISVIRQKRGN
jgi:hypothetical protein